MNGLFTIAIAFFQTMAVQEKLPSTFIEHFKEHSWFIVVCRYVLGIDTESCLYIFVIIFVVLIVEEK